ncbi:MAG TPA: penicillin-binding transpeptidase domain-containing protein [Lapillicoccus sp.]|nr:penicillin-binding transpeptidase domain-containing protein [Lapillicoccus sp.]
MNGPLRRVSTVVALLFAALFISTTLIQVIFAPSINARPDNRRTLLDNYSRQRGAILVGDQAVAVSQPTPNEEIKYLRTYPQPLPYSHTTGYFSYTYGAGGGLEGSADDLLSGSSSQLFYTRVTDLLTGKQPVGATIQTTINPKAQDAADKGLGNQRGAVMALDPKTGAILAMISHPQYDPNRLSAHDQASVVKAWNELNADPNQPLINRAIAGNLYPPGSVFKIVTASAALENGKVDANTQIPAPAVMELPQSSVGLPNYDRQPCGPNNQTTLLRALEISCNTAFGYLGMQVGAQALADQAAKFGFGTTMRIPTRAEPSRFPSGIDQAQTAQSAIGQYEVRVTPLQVAMVSAAIANEGVVMRPYLINQVLSADLQTLDRTAPERLGTAVSPQTADTLTQMLTSVVDQGTGTPAKIAGVKVAGKTGTAEQGNGKPPHAWFTAFAPADDPKVAVAVVVEDGGNAGNEAAGGRLAGPIAKAVMEAVLNQ